MTDPMLFPLLRDVILLLRAQGGVARQPEYRPHGYALADRIEAYLAGMPISMAPDDAVLATRLGWRVDPRIQIDDTTVMRLDGDGMWIAAWLLAGSYADGLGPVGSRRYALALAALPLMPREVLRLHRDEGLDYPTIGRQLGLGAAEVQRHLVDALIAIDAVLGPD